MLLAESLGCFTRSNQKASQGKTRETQTTSCLGLMAGCEGEFLRWEKIFTNSGTKSRKERGERRRGEASLQMVRPGGNVDPISPVCMLLGCVDEEYLAMELLGD